MPDDTARRVENALAEAARDLHDKVKEIMGEKEFAIGTIAFLSEPKPGLVLHKTDFKNPDTFKTAIQMIAAKWESEIARKH